VGARRPRPVVLDAGALIAFERNDRKVRVLVELSIQHGARLMAPAGVVAQTWRNGARQARLARLLASGVVSVQALDQEEAQAVGVLCGKSGSADVVDASVALLARRHGATVVSSDAADLQRIDPQLQVVTC
jgi:predicted nucleic acid-binding protein